MPNLRDVPIPPELSPLQASLAAQEVTAEIAQPNGLRLDQAITSPLTQYKHDLRVELSGHPKDITTFLAAKQEVLETFLVPPSPSAPPQPPPEQGPPELTSLDPAFLTIGVDTGEKPVKCLGGPFDDYCQIVWNGGVEPTQLVDENTLATKVSMATVSGPTTVPVLVRRGDVDTSALDFEFRPEPEPPEEPTGEGTGETLNPLSPGPPSESGGEAAPALTEG
jgi:hypothetical protein